jgi:hypothetical protein
MRILGRTGGHYSVTASGIISNAQSPSSEANSRTSGQEISNILWNPNVHYCVHSSLQLGEMYLLHSHTPVFLNITSVVIHELHRRLACFLFPSGLPIEIVYEFLSFSMNATHAKILLLIFRDQMSRFFNFAYRCPDKYKTGRTFYI